MICLDPVKSQWRRQRRLLLLYLLLSRCMCLWCAILRITPCQAFPTLPSIKVLSTKNIKPTSCTSPLSVLPLVALQMSPMDPSDTTRRFWTLGDDQGDHDSYNQNKEAKKSNNNNMDSDFPQNDLYRMSNEFDGYLRQQQQQSRNQFQKKEDDDGGQSRSLQQQHQQPEWPASSPNSFSWFNQAPQHTDSPSKNNSPSPARNYHDTDLSTFLYLAREQQLKAEKDPNPPFFTYASSGASSLDKSSGSVPRTHHMYPVGRLGNDGPAISPTTTASNQSTKNNKDRTGLGAGNAGAVPASTLNLGRQEPIYNHPSPPPPLPVFSNETTGMTQDRIRRGISGISSLYGPPTRRSSSDDEKPPTVDLNNSVKTDDIKTSLKVSSNTNHATTTIAPPPPAAASSMQDEMKMKMAHPSSLASSPSDATIDDNNNKPQAPWGGWNPRCADDEVSIIGGPEHNGEPSTTLPEESSSEVGFMGFMQTIVRSSQGEGDSSSVTTNSRGKNNETSSRTMIQTQWEASKSELQQAAAKPFVDKAFSTSTSFDTLSKARWGGQEPEVQREIREMKQHPNAPAEDKSKEEVKDKSSSPNMSISPMVVEVSGGSPLSNPRPVTFFVNQQQPSQSSTTPMATPYKGLNLSDKWSKQKEDAQASLSMASAVHVIKKRKNTEPPQPVAPTSFSKASRPRWGDHEPEISRAIREIQMHHPPPNNTSNESGALPTSLDTGNKPRLGEYQQEPGLQQSVRQMKAEPTKDFSRDETIHPVVASATSQPEQSTDSVHHPETVKQENQQKYISSPQPSPSNFHDSKNISHTHGNNEDAGNQESASTSPDIPDSESFSLPRGYEIVMEWAQRSVDLPTLNNVLFKLRNTRVAAFASEGVSRWGDPEIGRAFHEVKEMCDVIGIDMYLERNPSLHALNKQVQNESTFEPLQTTVQHSTSGTGSVITTSAAVITNGPFSMERVDATMMKPPQLPRKWAQLLHVANQHRTRVNPASLPKNWAAVRDYAGSSPVPRLQHSASFPRIWQQLMDWARDQEVSRKTALPKQWASLRSTASDTPAFDIENDSGVSTKKRPTLPRRWAQLLHVADQQQKASKPSSLPRNWKALCEYVGSSPVPEAASKTSRPLIWKQLLDWVYDQEASFNTYLPKKWAELQLCSKNNPDVAVEDTVQCSEHSNINEEDRAVQERSPQRWVQLRHVADQQQKASEPSSLPRNWKALCEYVGSSPVPYAFPRTSYPLMWKQLLDWVHAQEASLNTYLPKQRVALQSFSKNTTVSAVEDTIQFWEQVYTNEDDDRSEQQRLPQRWVQLRHVSDQQQKAFKPSSLPRNWETLYEYVGSSPVPTIVPRTSYPLLWNQLLNWENEHEVSLNKCLPMHWAKLQSFATRTDPNTTRHQVMVNPYVQDKPRSSGHIPTVAVEDTIQFWEQVTRFKSKESSDIGHDQSPDVLNTALSLGRSGAGETYDEPASKLPLQWIRLLLVADQQQVAIHPSTLPKNWAALRESMNSNPVPSGLDAPSPRIWKQLLDWVRTQKASVSELPKQWAEQSLYALSPPQLPGKGRDGSFLAPARSTGHLENWAGSKDGGLYVNTKTAAAAFVQQTAAALADMRKGVFAPIPSKFLSKNEWASATAKSKRDQTDGGSQQGTMSLSSGTVIPKVAQRNEPLMKGQKGHSFDSASQHAIPHSSSASRLETTRSAPAPTQKFMEKAFKNEKDDSASSPANTLLTMNVSPKPQTQTTEMIHLNISEPGDTPKWRTASFPAGQASSAGPISNPSGGPNTPEKPEKRRDILEWDNRNPSVEDTKPVETARGIHPPNQRALLMDNTEAAVGSVPIAKETVNQVPLVRLPPNWAAFVASTNTNPGQHEVKTDLDAIDL